MACRCFALSPRSLPTRLSWSWVSALWSHNPLIDDAVLLFLVGVTNRTAQAQDDGDPGDIVNTGND